MVQQATPSQSSARRTLAGLDLLRAIAIILVLLFHYRLFGHPDWILSACVFGWTGVDLFFVLSGYLIASQLFDKVIKGNNISMSEFYIKRTFRIIPAYAATLMLYFLIPSFNEAAGLSPLWKFVTFTQNFGLDQRYYRAFSHCWSLCVEEQFYLVLPLLIICMHFFKAGNKAFLIVPVLFILGFVLRILVWNHYLSPLTPGSPEFNIGWTKQMYYPTYTRLDGLLAGVSVAALTKFRPVVTKRIMQYGNLLLLLSLALVTVAYFVCLDRQSFTASVYGFPLVSVAYGVLVLAAISPTCILCKLKSRIISSIAILSYSIYLTHKGIFHLTQQWFSKLGVAEDSNLMIIICVALAVLAALVMRYAVEKPFLRWREKILDRRREKQKVFAVATAVEREVV